MKIKIKDKMAKRKLNSPNVVIVFHELLFLQFFQRFFTSKSFSLFFSILTNRNLKFEISENANNKKNQFNSTNFSAAQTSKWKRAKLLKVLSSYKQFSLEQTSETFGIPDRNLLYELLRQTGRKMPSHFGRF